jgi:hypothetical protein
MLSQPFGLKRPAAIAVPVSSVGFSTMTCRFAITALLLALAAGPAAAAGVLDEALSYTKPVPGGRFVFVMLGDPEAEAKQSADARGKFAELRAKYPKTGLYREGSNELVWAVEDGGYAKDYNLFPASDGAHLVRIDGEWWREKDFTGGRNMLTPEEERKQLDGPAVSFFAGGKLMKRYAVRDVVTGPAALPQTPHYILWTTGGVLNEDTGRFLLDTQDSNRVAFDYRTGEVLARSRVGLSNPLLTTVLAVSGALTAVVLGVWAYLVFFRRRKPVPVAGPNPS